jgi:predicted nucleic acid-binding protein
MPSTDRRCSPSFPARRCLVDSSIIIRFFKCGRLDALKSRDVRVVVAGQVRREIRRDTTLRDQFEQLGAELVSIRPGGPEWDTYSTLIGAGATNNDRGELESIAVALTAGAADARLPFLCCDNKALKKSIRRGLVTLDFLDTLAWLVACGVLGVGDADAIELRAREVDGWQPPEGYAGSVETERAARQARVVADYNATSA